MSMQARSASSVAFVLALAALPAWSAKAEPIRAVYSVRGGGLQVMRVEAVLDLDMAGRYSIRALWRTTGVARLFGGADFSGSAEGRWAGGAAQPVRYAVDGSWRGEPRRTVLEYPSGQPVMRIRLPESDPEREPVPEALRRGTMDQFSAIAQLTRVIAETGRCDGRASVFDGTRRVEMQARTVGRDRIFPWSTAWHGEALRCAFTGRQTAGFRRDASDAEREKEPKEGIAWMAPPRPGDVPIPVRLEVPSRLFGALTIYLMEVGPAALPSRQAANSAAN